MQCLAGVDCAVRGCRVLSRHSGFDPESRVQETAVDRHSRVGGNLHGWVVDGVFVCENQDLQG